MAGRKQDIVWHYFERTSVTGNCGYRAKWKSCGKEMQGLLARMKSHYNICSQGLQFIFIVYFALR